MLFHLMRELQLNQLKKSIKTEIDLVEVKISNVVNRGLTKQKGDLLYMGVVLRPIMCFYRESLFGVKWIKQREKQEGLSLNEI